MRNSSESRMLRANEHLIARTSFVSTSRAAQMKICYPTSLVLVSSTAMQLRLIFSGSGKAFLNAMNASLILT
ncbi:MAG: hypothetical protein M1503_02560 [Thaumarchaeota archaeon]|nr:hypothetical protein [Nitrososphaerota archaeon]MCL5317133.1 hypothetical protein [Nitrososphaerota archaeon]